MQQRTYAKQKLYNVRCRRPSAHATLKILTAHKLEVFIYLLYTYIFVHVWICINMYMYIYIYMCDVPFVPKLYVCKLSLTKKNVSPKLSNHSVPMNQKTKRQATIKP